MRALMVYESMYGNTRAAQAARRWGMTLGAASKTYLPAHA